MKEALTHGQQQRTNCNQHIAAEYYHTYSRVVLDTIEEVDNLIDNTNIEIESDQNIQGNKTNKLNNVITIVDTLKHTYLLATMQQLVFKRITDTRAAATLKSYQHSDKQQQSNY